MKHPALTIRAVRTRAVNVPMNRPLGTSAARMEMAPFVLVDLETDEGVLGRAHVFCYLDLAAPLIRRVIAELGDSLRNAAVDPTLIGRLGRSRFALLGTPGVVGMALSVLDVACWDALARAAGLPLGRYLGGTAETVAAYNSNGLGLTDPDGLADEAHELLASGIRGRQNSFGSETTRATIFVQSAAVRDAIAHRSLC